MRRYLLPVLLVIIFVSESIYVELFSGHVFGLEQVIVPHFLFVAILLLAIYVNESYGLFYGVIFGVLYDVVYTEVLGVYLFLFPLLIYLLAKLMRFLHNHLVVTFFMAMIGIVLLEVVVYEINYLIRFTDFTFDHFLHFRLYPTLVLNSAFLLIFSYPLKKHYEKLALYLAKE